MSIANMSSIIVRLGAVEAIAVNVVLLFTHGINPFSALTLIGTTAAAILAITQPLSLRRLLIASALLTTSALLAFGAYIPLLYSPALVAWLIGVVLLATVERQYTGLERN